MARYTACKRHENSLPVMKKSLMNVVHEPGEIITLLRYFLSPSLPEPSLKEISTKSRIPPLRVHGSRFSI